MKWLTFAGILLYLSRQNDAAVLKCTPESQDPSCKLEKREILKDLTERDRETASADTECLAGSEWESNCHYCRCSESGIAECLKQESCDLEIFEEPIKCKPLTSFRRDCNTCTCLMNGLGLCTLMECFYIQRKKREIECEPGSSWQSNCNHCHCSQNGHAVCTKRGCLNHQDAVQKICSPGTKWKDDCNTCHCTADGQPACTEIKCNSFDNSNLEKRDTIKSNGTLFRQIRAVQETAKMCQPGTEFRMDCNKCLCNDEGQDFSCTRIDCAAQNNNGGVDSFSSTRSKREVSSRVEVQCTADSVFEQSCNLCRCTKDGAHAVCVLKRCKNETVSAEPDTEPSFRCTPGDQFKRDCNDCTCSADGKTVFCTIRLCDEQPGI